MFWRMKPVRMYFLCQCNRNIKGQLYLCLLLRKVEKIGNQLMLLKVPLPFNWQAKGMQHNARKLLVGKPEGMRTRKIKM
jgi:hypothetical protein